MSIDLSERLRRYANVCRGLANIAPDDRFRQTLVELAEELEAEAAGLDGSAEI